MSYATGWITEVNVYTDSRDGEWSQTFRVGETASGRDVDTGETVRGTILHFWPYIVPGEVAHVGAVLGNPGVRSAFVPIRTLVKPRGAA